MLIELLWFSFCPAKMPRQRRIPGPPPVEEVRHVRDWAPPGWHWEVSPSGERSLVRIPGPVADPDLIWWDPMGPHPYGLWHLRPQDSEMVIRRRIRDEDAHVRRYMVSLARDYRNGWSFIQRDPNPGMSYAPVRVPYLWMRTAPRPVPLGFGTVRN